MISLKKKKLEHDHQNGECIWVTRNKKSLPQTYYPLTFSHLLRGDQAFSSTLERLPRDCTVSGLSGKRRQTVDTDSGPLFFFSSLKLCKLKFINFVFFWGSLPQTYSSLFNFCLFFGCLYSLCWLPKFLSLSLAELALKIGLCSVYLDFIAFWLVSSTSRFKKVKHYLSFLLQCQTWCCIGSRECKWEPTV